MNGLMHDALPSNFKALSSNPNTAKKSFGALIFKYSVFID
jgi:hypothetical protein